jgi:hypothetical protein
LNHTNPPPVRLDFARLTVGPLHDGRAELTIYVVGEWRSTDKAGRTSGYRSDAHSWRFQTRDDNGWQVVAVDAPAWCGGYVPTQRCR